MGVVIFVSFLVVFVLAMNLYSLTGDFQHQLNILKREVRPEKNKSPYGESINERINRCSKMHVQLEKDLDKLTSIVAEITNDYYSEK